MQSSFFEYTLDIRKEIVLDNIKNIIENNQKAYLSCINPHSYYLAKNDILFKKALNGSNILVPDGIGIVYGLRFLLNIDIKERITGQDIFEGILNTTFSEKKSVFFLGSSENVLSKIKKKFILNNKNFRYAGHYSPPFKKTFTKEDIEIIKKRINEANVDILFIGMGAPKQEKLIHEIINDLNINVACAIGAVFDFYVGNIKRSSSIYRKNGLEWLPRLLQEPKRLWRRMLISAPVYIFDIIKYKYKKKLWKKLL